MRCPRCQEHLSIFYKKKENKMQTTEYFCGNCISAVVETEDEKGKYSSEWIDFNV